jgi:hypothetical protein
MDLVEEQYLPMLSRFSFTKYKVRLNWLEYVFFCCAMLLAGVVILEQFQGLSDRYTAQQPGYRVQMARLEAEQPVVASGETSELNLKTLDDDWALLP